MPFVNKLFQSTRPARGATPHQPAQVHNIGVSIHAPRAGRDGLSEQWNICECVSIHAPRAGRDTETGGSAAAACLFQSTRPARGATSKSCLVESLAECFNPRAPRGARRITTKAQQVIQMFQSTRPARGATAIDILRFVAFVCFNPRAPRGARHFHHRQS